MNPRFEYGGDKWQSIRNDELDEYLPFYERVKAKEEEILDCLRGVVSTWTENEIDAMNEPLFERFIDDHPEWDKEPLYITIEAEIARITLLCRKERGA